MRRPRLDVFALLVLGACSSSAAGEPPHGGTTTLTTVPCAVPAGADPRVKAAMPRAGLACTRYRVVLGAPRDVIEASDGALYVSEMSTGQISRIDASAAANASTNGDAGAAVVAARVTTGLLAPIGLREAPDGSLVVAEEGGRVSRVDRATGTRTSVVEGIGNATYLALDPSGADAYVSTFSDLAAPTGIVHRVELASGAMSDFATGLVVPEGLAFDEHANLAVAEWGKKPSSASLHPSGDVVATGFTALYGVARAPGEDGWLVADVQGDRVAWVHADGRVEDVLTGVAAPAGLFFARNGDLLVAEHVAADTHDGRGYILRLSGF